MADSTSLRDLKARIRLDSSDVTAGQKRVAAATGKMGADLERTGVHTGKLSGSFVRLNTELGKFGPVGAVMTSRLDAVGLGAASAEGGLAGLAVGASAAAVALSFDLAKSASDLNEQLTASRVVFGDSAGAIERYAKGMAAAGLSEKDAVQATTQIATGLKAVGFQDASLARISTTLVSLATDLSSFSNIPVPEALEAIQAGLRGEFDPLERFGVHLNADAVAAEAVKEGLASSTQQMTAQAKAAATINLVLAQTATQQNDVARSGGTLASNMRELNADSENLKTTLGSALLPIWVELLSAGVELTTIIEGVSHKLDDVTHSSQGFIGGILQGANPAIAEINLLAGAHDKSAKSVTDYGKAQVKTTDITKAATQATKEQDTALQKLNDTILGSIDSDLGLEQARLRSKQAVDQSVQAQTDLNDAIKRYGPNSDQARQASDALKQSILDGRAASISETQAALKQAQAHAELSGKTLTARDSMLLEIAEFSKFRDQIAPGSPLRAYLDSYINDLQTRIPRNVNTTVTITTVSLSGRSGGNLAIEGRAEGGIVVPGHVYDVGETGPERLVMDRRGGGYVIPNGSEVSVSNMASTRRIERLLEAQNQLLSVAIASQPSATFSPRVYQV